MPISLISPVFAKDRQLYTACCINAGKAQKTPKAEGGARFQASLSRAFTMLRIPTQLRKASWLNVKTLGPGHPSCLPGSIASAGTRNRSHLVGRSWQGYVDWGRPITPSSAFLGLSGPEGHTHCTHGHLRPHERNSLGVVSGHVQGDWERQRGPGCLLATGYHMIPEMASLEPLVQKSVTSSFLHAVNSQLLSTE